MSDSKVYEIPRKGWNDYQPMWIGTKVFYLSDPSGPVGLHSYDVATKKVTAEVPGSGFDIKSASAGPGVIVYAKLGSIHIFDIATRKSTQVKINVKGDFRETRPTFKTVSNSVTSMALSPNGQRLLATARGWVFTIPASGRPPPRCVLVARWQNHRLHHGSKQKAATRADGYRLQHREAGRSRRIPGVLLRPNLVARFHQAHL
jgi:tricorn protease